MVRRRAGVPLRGRSCLGFWCWKVACVAATRWSVRAADPRRRQCQVGSLAGAAHLSNDNAGVLRRAQRERKSREEQKGKSSLDSDFQYEYEP